GAMSLKYTTAAGTTACGGAGFSSPAGAPFSGEIDSDAACTTKTFDLGSSCLYIGGGSASTVPPGATPAGASSYLDVGAGNALVSRVYLTGNEAAPCPQCSGGTCSAGPNSGMGCTTNATTGNPATSNTTHDCPPEEGSGLFNGALSVDLNPLTTGSSSKTS